MEAQAQIDESCRAFARLGDLEPETLHRLVVGQDQAPRSLTTEEAAAELSDPFAKLLLLQGTFPHTAMDLLAAIDQATAEDDPLRQQMSFLVGEGSQLDDPELASRGLRFLVTRGQGVEGPDLIISVFDPEQEDSIELMAWDADSGGFNYYRSLSGGAWVFAGNSLAAVSQGTEGKGPFESHTAGNLLMKELKTPWINWDSPAAPIPPTVFGPGDSRAQHPWFVEREPQGAITLEAAVARPSFRRWTRIRFEKLLADGGQIERPERILRQILTTPTANLVSTHVESDLASSRDLDLPITFFVDADALSILELPPPESFTLPGALYAQTLSNFEVRLDDEDGFTRPGDTHFAFVVPERAAEDQEVLRQAIDTGLISKRLAACLLMTDFPNPVFSARRAALLAHTPAQAKIENGASTFSEEMAQAILAAADDSPEGSAEREFAERWGVGDDWPAEFSGLLTAYYQAVSSRLGTQEASDDYFRLAESRRNHFKLFPISEFPLLFARSNLPVEERVMNPDATVA